MELNGLLTRDVRVVAAGAPVLADALGEQAVPVEAVDWRPPGSCLDDLDLVMGDRRRTDANALAVRRMLDTRAHLVDVRPASELLDLPPGAFLHAGPPMTWDGAAGPMRGALIGATLFEGLADTPADAERFARTAELAPCHHHGAVGPMAGVVSPSMWMLVVADGDRTAYCSLNEGLGKVLRYGAYGPEVIERLRWMADVLGPALAAAVRARGPLDLRTLMAQALHMGDELHNRNRAATSLLIRELAADIAEPDVLRFMAGNDHFFLNLAMAAGKLGADAARDVPGSTLVVAMARNGTDFGIQVSGTGDRWFTGPAGLPDGLYLGSYGPGDANPDIGDSAITETTGVGGFAMAAAPAVVRFVGGEVSDALAATRRMYEITMAEHPVYQVPVLGFRGTPTGIDVTRVVRTGILPVIDTGIAGRVAGVGQVGAGVIRPPAEVFDQALRCLARKVGGSG